MRKAGQAGSGAAGSQRVAPLLPIMILLLAAACNTDTPKTSTGRTERETDSVIGQSKIPGASGVTKAMAAQDSARARAAAIDTAAAHETP